MSYTLRTPRQLAADTLRDLRNSRPGMRCRPASFIRSWAACNLMSEAYKREVSHLAISRDYAGVCACAAMILRTEPGR